MKTIITSFLFLFILCSYSLNAQTTQLRSSDCNTTNVLTTTDLYANDVPGATQYRFRIDNGQQIQEITKPVRFFSIDELGQTLYNTIHNVTISVEVGGTFGPFGPNCTVQTAPFPCQLRSSDCGRLLNNMSQDVYANVVGADEYYFEVTNLLTSDVDTITKSVRSFRLNDLPSPTFDTEYRVRVSVLLDGVLQPFGNECSLFIDVDPNSPRILSQYCGTTFELLAYEYMKTYVPSGATNFEFRITNGLDQFSVETTADSIRFVDFVDLPTLHYAYNTTYDVDVRAFVSGAWTDFGPICQVSTAPFPETSVQHLCGQTVTSFSQPVSVFAVFSATEYEFEITDIASSDVYIITKDIATFGSTARRFSINELPDFGYGRDYSVRSRVEFDGVYHSFGDACIVSSPDAITQLRLADCGKSLNAFSELVYADEVIGATTYRFEVTNLTTLGVEVIDNPTRSFSLSQLSDPQFNTTYEVRVQVEYESVFQPYGTICDLQSPSVVLARLRTPDCGRELLLMNQAIYSNRSDEDSYTFEFTNLTDMSVETIVKATRDVRLSELSDPQEDVEYQVRISVIRDGETLPFGPACSVFSPSSSMFIPNNDILEFMSMEEQDLYIQELQEKISNGESFLDNKISIYPNPTSNYINFNLNNDLKNQIVDILVYDSQGRIIDSIISYDSNEINNLKIGTDYSSGLYRIVIQNEQFLSNMSFIKK